MLRSASRAITRNIVLTGPPGSGKTSVARIVGAKLGLPVLDVDDHHLEKYWGTSVADKFNNLISRGASYQELINEECTAFRELQTNEPTVISLSGSNTVTAESRKHIESLGTTFYLDVPLGDIEKRLIEMKVDRIISHDPDASMSEILKYRTQFYQQAYDYRIMTTPGDDIESIAEQVLQSLERFASGEKHVSTRGDGGKISFNEVVFESVARDGGLYVPNFQTQPFTPGQIKRIAEENMTFEEVAQRVQEKFIPPKDVKPYTNKTFIKKAYQSFGCSTRVNVNQLGGFTKFEKRKTVEKKFEKFGEIQLKETLYSTQHHIIIS